MKNTIALLALLVLCWIGASCKKNSQQDPIPSRIDLLSRLWKVNQVLINGKLDDSKDYYSWSFNFRKDGKYIISNSKGIIQGTWELSSDEKTQLLNKGQMSEEQARIIVLNQMQLELEFAETSSQSNSKKITFKLIQ